MRFYYVNIRCMDAFLHQRRKEYIEMVKQDGYYTAYRPEEISEAAWEAIVDAWRDGLSDREAAFGASNAQGELITEAELKEFVLIHKEVADLRDYLQSDVIKISKQNVAKSIRDGNVSTSKWLLERKAANEYSTRASVHFEDAVVGLTMAEKEAEMDKFIDGILSNGDSDGEREV